MTAPRSYRALRILLFAISVIEAVAGVALLFASSWVLSFVAANVGLPASGYVIALLKAIGILAVALGYLLCVTARDPERYVAVIDTLAFVLVAAAALEVYALGPLQLAMYYPVPYLIVRALVQLAIAVALIALRPRGVAAVTTPPPVAV